MSFSNQPARRLYTKDKLENLIAKKRERELVNLSKWQDQVKYLETSTIRATKDQHWNSNSIQSASQVAFNQQNEQIEVEADLRFRRSKLSYILRKDANQHKTDILNILDQIRFGCTIENRKLQDLSMGNSKQNTINIAENLLNSHLPELDERLNRHIPPSSEMNHMPDSLKYADKPITDCNKREYHMNQDIAVCHANEDEVKSEAIKQDSRKHAEADNRARTLEEQQACLFDLRKRLDEIHDLDSKVKCLNEEDAYLQNKLKHLEQLGQELFHINEECRKELYDRMLVRRHHLALRRASNAVQSELLADIDWLKRMSMFKNDVRAIRGSNTLVRLSELLETDLMKEQELFRRLDDIQGSEAARLWTNCEVEWRDDLDSRQKLLRDLYEDFKSDLIGELKNVQIQQRDVLETQDDLLQVLERAKDSVLTPQPVDEDAVVMKDSRSGPVQPDDDKYPTDARPAFCDSECRHAEAALTDRIRTLHMSHQNPENQFRSIDYASKLLHRPGGNIW